MVHSILTSSFVRACAVASLLGLVGYSPLLKASNFTVAGIEVQEPQATATSAGQPNGAIFIQAISNKAGKADRLVAARSAAAASMELHNMTMDGGVMRMREIPGIDLPAGGKVLMHRGSKEGYHLMLMGLKKPLEVGQVIPVTLIFEKAGELEVKATVVDMRANRHGSHPGSAGMHKPSQGVQAEHAHHHAHKHGDATLEVSLEKGRLSLQFLSPMDNLVGFEHAPKNERQVKALEDLQRLLENPFNLFEPNKEALCKRGQVVIQSKLLGKSDPVALQKDEHGHADLRYEAGFECGAPSLLTTINVTAFRSFRRLNEIDVELIADRPGGLARSFELNRKRSTIEF